MRQADAKRMPPLLLCLLFVLCTIIIFIYNFHDVLLKFDHTNGAPAQQEQDSTAVEWDSYIFHLTPERDSNLLTVCAVRALKYLKTT